MGAVSRVALIWKLVLLVVVVGRGGGSCQREEERKVQGSDSRKNISPER